MNEKIFEEDLSISYLRAIAAKAEVEFELKRRDVESKDANLSKLIKMPEGEFEAELNVQLKTTCSKSQYSESDTEITYALKSKNYNDLCRSTTTPIILCLLILPEIKNDWVIQTKEKITMQKCMYWISLKGLQPTSNGSSCNIKIPKTNILDADALNKLLRKIADNGGEL